jgi:hypothetical protein
MIYTDMEGHRHRSRLGKAHFQKAYDFLMSQPALSPVEEASCLNKAAELLATSNDKVLAPSYKTQDGTAYWDLMDRTCNHSWAT